MGIIEDIKARLSIEDVVSKHVELKPSGSNLKGRCPFHGEKTPSFFVFPDKGRWHCFGGCGVGGDIFSFIEKIRGVEFKDALAILAEQASIPLPQKQGAERDTLYKMNGVAAQCYYDFITDEVRSYLFKRGFTQDTIDKFKIGLSPAEPTRLLDYLKRQGYSIEDMVKSGLVIKKGIDLKDYFFNRIMFPIRDDRGLVLGFSGRILEGSKSKVKYINSPDTVIFKKRNLLWGIDRAKEAMRKENCVVLVEGYTDVMMAHQFGFTNTVGIMGSSITSEHIMTIKKYTRNVLLALDPDDAGREATLRGIKVARSTFSGHAPVPEWAGGTNASRGALKIIELPVGKDPDEFIMSDSAGWRKLVASAQPVMGFLFKSVLSRLDLNTEMGKASAAEQLVPIISEINDPVENELYLQRLSEIVGVRPDVLLTYTQKTRRSSVVAADLSSANGNNIEEYCLAILLQSGYNDEIVSLSQLLKLDDFTKIENREIFKVWQARGFPEDVSLQRHYDHLMSQKLVIAGAGALSDCVKGIKADRLRQEKMMLLSLVKDAATQEEKQALLLQIENLNRGGL